MEENNDVIVFEDFLTERKITIGLNIHGQFVSSFSGKGFSIIEENNLVSLLRLLEIDFSIFIKKIAELIKEFNSQSPMIKAELDGFPSREIVKLALSGDRDYWVELSLPWVLKMGQRYFSQEIIGISRNKKIGQKTRHKQVNY